MQEYICIIQTFGFEEMSFKLRHFIIGEKCKIHPNKAIGDNYVIIVDKKLYHIVKKRFESDFIPFYRDKNLNELLNEN